jgi:hypothetical protein
VPVDRRSDGVIDDLIDIWVFGEFDDLVLKTLCEVDPIGVEHLCDAVGFDHGGKERESLLYIKPALVSIHVDACNFDVISRPGSIYVVSKQNHFFASGNTTREHLTR